MGGLVVYKAVGEETAGAYCLSWSQVPPGAGPEPHIQSREDEGFFVLSGELAVRVGDRSLTVRAGDYLNIRSGSAHRFVSAGRGSAEVLVLNAPAGFDRFQREFGVPLPSADATVPAGTAAPDALAAELAEAAPRYGFTLNPPASEFAKPAAFHHTPAGTGPAYSVVGDRYVIKIPGEATGGRYAVFEFFIPPDHGPPPHIHSREEEGFYILEGALTFYVGDPAGPTPPARVTVEAGGYVNAPRDVPHRFRNEGSVPVKAICIVAPAGVDRFFAEIGTPLPDASAPAVEPTPADIQKLMAVAPKYGLTIIPPKH
jgi:mannose-6-phosphate isomerase-like protein (cupin superfamily)